MLKVTDAGCGMHTTIEMTDRAIKAIVLDYISRFFRNKSYFCTPLNALCVLQFPNIAFTQGA